jgi:hypothetical protein
MDPIDRFINEQNIKRFTQQAYDELDAVKQQKLRNLLIEEEYRLGLHSTHLEIATRAINDAEARISRQEALIARMEAVGDDVSEANRMLALPLLAPCPALLGAANPKS